MRLPRRPPTRPPRRTPRGSLSTRSSAWTSPTPTAANLTATFYGREVTGVAAPDFTIIAMPDTQYYSASYPATYAAQTQWLVDNRVSRNIAYIAQLGDCVDNATIAQQ
jgi:hypothetical protein